jgi:UDP-N-acetylglucosamine 2-epimerase (non-hydrolysing)
MKLAVVYGTRPEFLKLKVLIEHFKPVVIRIDQHENYNEDEGFYTYRIKVENGPDRLSSIGSSILTKLPELIRDCTHVLSQGDTASCFYSLITAYQMKKTCVHLEAGMRTYQPCHPWPEESYRQMISRIASIHLCPSEQEADNLRAERVAGTIHVVGNTILDLVRSYNYPVTYQKKVIVTLHRRENWENYRGLIQKLDKLARKNSDTQFIFFVHPNPELQRIVNEEGSSLVVSPPVDHPTLIKLLAECACVITDSGGIQEESNFLGKHIYILREYTERLAIPKHKYTLMPDIESIDVNPRIHEPGFEYGDGHTVLALDNCIV